MGRFRYVSILDIDEVIMPLKHSNWGDMMADLEKISHPQTAYYSFANTYFMYESPNKKNLSGIPEYMRMTRQEIRHTAKLFSYSFYLHCRIPLQDHDPQQRAPGPAAQVHDEGARSDQDDDRSPPLGLPAAPGGGGGEPRRRVPPGVGEPSGGAPGALPLRMPDADREDDALQGNAHQEDGGRSHLEVQGRAHQEGGKRAGKHTQC